MHTKDIIISSAILGSCFACFALFKIDIAVAEIIGFFIFNKLARIVYLMEKLK